MRYGLLRSMIPAYSVCQSVTQLHCANTAERIEVLLGVETLAETGNPVLDGSSDFPHGFDVQHKCKVYCHSCNALR